MMFGPHRELLVPCPKCGSVEHIAKDTVWNGHIIGYTIGCMWCGIEVQLPPEDHIRLEEKWNEYIRGRSE